MSETFATPTRIIIILMLVYLSQTRLTTKPVNQAGFHRETTEVMECSSDIGSNAITWYFTLFNTTDNATVAVGANISPEFPNSYMINQPNSQASNLIIPRASNLNAGTYTCSDGSEAASAQHSVMAFEPRVIYSNVTSTTKNGDLFYYTCTAKYYGNDFMTLRFYFMPDSPSLAQNITNTEITEIGSLRHATGTAFGIAECGLFQGMCHVYFNEPKGNLPSDSATNAPTFWWMANLSDQIQISCVPTDESMTIIGPTDDNLIYYGATITCNVESSTPVNYMWTDFTYGNTSPGQQLTVWHSGTYRCKASTEQDGKTYAGSKTFYNLIVLPIKGSDISLSAFPLFGPIAGGTRIKFAIKSWSDQIANISGVYIGYTLTAAIVHIDLQKKSFVIFTPIANDAQVEQPLQITIEITPGPFNFTTGLYFTYRSNPEITNLSPNSFIVTGGTSINVTGSSLSSISNPLIQVTLTVTRVKPTDNIVKTTNDSCKVTNSKGTEMVCKMPPVDMPKDFLDILDSSHPAANTTAASSSVLEVTGPNGIDRAIVYLGFILDGYQKYDNINNVLRDTQILLHSSPEINSSQNVYEYDPSKEKLFLIEGNRLTLGCRLSDYVVHAGNAICENIDLQDNALTVRLPKTEPQITQNDTNICDKYLNTRISIGYKKYHYCCLKYKSSYTVLIIAVCACAGGLLLLVIAIIGVICFCRKYSKGKSGNNDSNAGHQHSEISGQSHEEFQESLRTNDDYLQAIELE